MLYFAYGSNMHAAQMNERCPSAKFVCRGKLPSHRLAFTLRSYSRRCGVADILSDENRYVWREGDAKRPLLVALYRGHPQPNPPLPDCDYKNVIVAGAKHWQLPADYIRELESIQTG